jgi:hypothetical protein
VSVPDNWVELKGGQDQVWFAPEGGYGRVQGQDIFTHGINFGVTQSQGSLQQTMNQMINGWLQGNPNMRQLGRPQGSNAGRRYWMSARFRNTNEATGRPESVNLFATQLSNGNVLVISQVLPENETADFQDAMNRIMNSVQINDQ